jgi:hypothetical protein
MHLKLNTTKSDLGPIEVVYLQSLAGRNGGLGFRVLKTLSPKPK